MKNRRNPFFGTLTALAAFGIAPFAGAASVTWNVAGGGTWNTSNTNWTGDATAFTNGDTANFANTVTGSINLSGTIAPAATNVSAASGTYTFTGTGITSGTLTKTGAGTLILQNSNSHTGTTTVNGGKITVSASGSLTGNGALSIGIVNPSAGIFQYDSNASSSVGTITIGSNTNGNGTLNQTAGQITASSLRMSTVFSGNVGTVNLSGGTLRITGNASVGERASGAGGGASNVNVSASGILQVDGSLTLGGGGSADHRHGTGVLTQTGGAVTISTGLVFTRAADATYTRRGTYNLDGGILNVNQISQAAAGTGTQTGTFNFNGGTLKASGSSTTFMQGITTANVKDGGARIDTNGENITVGQNLLHFAGATTDSLTKSGNGTLTLSGNNTYTGHTNVTDGTLRINGSLANTTTTVSSGATLAGTGSIGGAVTINLGGTLAPGASAGTLEINNTLGLNQTSTLDFELNPFDTSIGGGINDLVAGVTSLTLDGLLNVTATSSSFAGITSGTWRLFNYSGSLTNNILTLNTMPGLDAGYSWYLDTATTNQINLTIVPEPRAALIGGIGIIVILRRRRAS